MYRLLLPLLLLAQGLSAPLVLPRLRFNAPSEWEGVETRLQAIDPARFADVVSLTGGDMGGPPIQVTLVSESTSLAREVPRWVAGFAVGGSSAVVIFPSRSPSYPDNTIDDVLRHEVAHVLIYRAAEGRPVPRWFNEGLAMSVERERRFVDQTQLLYQLMTGPRTSLSELERMFSGSQDDQTLAYAVAGAVVHDLLQDYGRDAGARILHQMGQGTTFDTAFRSVSGSSPETVEAAFWRRQRIWTTWIPIAASSTSLWSGITLLALLAIYRRRRKNQEIEKRWADEDAAPPHDLSDIN